MPMTRTDLESLLHERGITAVTTDHPPLHTVAESKALRGRLEGGHTKNLFLKDKKSRYFLVTLEEDLEIDLKGLHKRIGANGRVSFGSAEALEAMFGVKPGAVTLFGPLNDTDHEVTVFVDQGLLAHDKINCHPFENTATTTIAVRDVLALLEDHGHKANILPREAEPTEQG